MHYRSKSKNKYNIHSILSQKYNSPIAYKSSKNIVESDSDSDNKHVDPNYIRLAKAIKPKVNLRVISSNIYTPDKNNIYSPGKNSSDKRASG